MKIRAGLTITAILIGFGPAAEDVADLDEVRAAARPAALRVQKTRGAEDRDQPVEVALEIADGDDAVGLAKDC